MAAPANLDAFIKREDFYAESPKPGEEFSPVEIGVIDLQASTLAPLLRKPDFQRTTAAWTPERIKDFIKSFVDGDLIPAVIFWSSKTGNIVVVDGAHRLSALLAWIHDDYGDKDISRAFQGHYSDSDQDAAAVATRILVNKKVGPFKWLMDAVEKPDASEEEKTRSRKLRRRKIKVQWIEGDAEKAEDSFYRINLNSVRIDRTELYLIRNREKPLAIATRAIVQHGDGHPYWDKFTAKEAEDTITIAKELHALLFSPPYKEPIETTDLPIAGKAYAGGSMELILNLLEYSNKGRVQTGTTGENTVAALQRMWGVISLLTGRDNHSLGLHPAIYFYNHGTGAPQAEALMSVVRWITDLKERQWLPAFTKCRRSFEEFLLLNSHVVSAIIQKKGTRMRGVPTIISFYDLVLRELMDAADFTRIFRKLNADPSLKSFIAPPDDHREYSREISDTVKSSVFLREALKGGLMCTICGARYRAGAFNWDHIIEASKDGRGDPHNIQQTHPYCNSGKEGLIATITKHRERTGERL